MALFEPHLSSLDPWTVWKWALLVLLLLIFGAKKTTQKSLGAVVLVTVAAAGLWVDYSDNQAQLKLKQIEAEKEQSAFQSEKARAESVSNYVHSLSRRARSQYSSSEKDMNVIIPHPPTRVEVERKIGPPDRAYELNGCEGDVFLSTSRRQHHAQYLAFCPECRLDDIPEEPLSESLRARMKVLDISYLILSKRTVENVLKDVKVLRMTLICDLSFCSTSNRLDQISSPGSSITAFSEHRGR